MPSLLSSEKTDAIGALASGLCLIHCIATPFIFIAHSCAKSCCSEAPAYWVAIDYVFLAISFLAIFYNKVPKSKAWVKQLLWASWGLLSFIIINESTKLISLSHHLIYIPAISMIGLHLYSMKYCKCEKGCCTTKANNHRVDKG